MTHWVVEGWELEAVLSPGKSILSNGTYDEASGGNIGWLVGRGWAPVFKFGNLSGESSMVTMESGTGKEVAEPWRVACRLITCRYRQCTILLHCPNHMPCNASMQRVLFA